MSRFRLLTVFASFVLLAAACDGAERKSPPLGGDGGDGGTGGGSDESVTHLSPSACSDFSRALERIRLQGSDDEHGRCVEVVLASPQPEMEKGVSLPSGWAIERAALHPVDCARTSVATAARATAAEGEIAFDEVEGGIPTRLSVDVTLTFGGEDPRYRLVAAGLEVDTCDAGR